MMHINDAYLGTIVEKLSNAEILLADFGASIGIEELSFNDENRCNLLFDEVAITIELLEDTGTVYIYSYLCQIRDDEQTEVQSLLLHANYLFNLSGFNSPQLAAICFKGERSEGKNRVIPRQLAAGIAIFSLAVFI